MDVIESLRLRVIRLQVFVADRPVLRHPVRRPVRGEVLLPQPEQRRAVHLGGAADEIMHAGLKRLVVLVIPGVFGDVAVLYEDFRGVPIRFLAG